MIRIQLGSGKAMHISNRNQTSWSQKLRSLQNLRAANLTKKTGFIGLLICIFLLYFAPYLYEKFTYSFSFNAEQCMSRHINQYEKAIAEFDAFIFNSHRDEDEERPPLPFVGNGKLGTVVNRNAELYLFYEIPVTVTNIDKKSVTRIEEELFKLKFNPLLKVESEQSGIIPQDDSTVVNFREGIVEQLRCFRSQIYSSKSIFLNHTVVAHRSRPNVLLQHMSFLEDNGDAGSTGAQIHLKMDPISSDKTFTLDEAIQKPYSVYNGVVDIPSGGFMAVVLARNIKSTSEILTTNPGKNHLDVVTVVQHSEVFKLRNEAFKSLEQVKEKVIQNADEVLSLSSDQLLREHKAAWKDILHTGLTVSTADQPGIPSPRTINSTLYYMLSSSDSKLHDKNIPEKERRDLMKRLETPDFCYQEHPTFHGGRLWREVGTIDDIVQLQQLWSLTLRKHKCESLVSEGAEGILQAMLLSFGGFQFTESDLRLETDADVLHNDIAFHSLVYRNTTLDVAIMKDVHDHSMIEITLKGHPKLPLYACEAGCVNEPVELKNFPQLIPIYVTEPPTPILYISHDKKHLFEIKATSHIKQRLEYSEHMEQIRKGSGLPWIFWLGIGSLIILFHMFLIRLIWKEYHSSISTSSKYSYGSRSRLSS